MPLARIVLLLAASVCSLTADTEYVMKTNFDGHESIVRHYLRGNDMRTEDVEAPGSSQRVTIFSFKRRAIYQVDEGAKQYTKMQGPDLVTELAAWITRAPRFRESGKTVNIYYETIDTGERRQMFGLTTRHLIFHERHVAEPGACAGNSEIDRDGWYASPRSATAHLEYGSYALAGGIPCHDKFVRHGNLPNPGMPLEEKRTSRYSNPFGPARVSSESREVLEFSTEPLDESLFEVPKGFQRVDDANWTDHLAFDWSQLERAFSSWFE